MRIWRFFLLLFIPASLAAQRIQQAPGSVRGSVFDSMLGAPLPGATIWLDDRSASAIADGNGQFQLAGIAAGDRVLLLSHPALDSLGLPELPRRVTVTSGREVRADLAVPSLNTIYRFICKAPMPVGLRGVQVQGVVIGTVLDAASRRRVKGALVEASWLAQQNANSARVGRSILQAVTDSVGDFHICGVPVDRTITLVASGAFIPTGSVDLMSNARGLMHQNLYVSLDSAVADSSGFRGRAVVTGVVRDESDRPIVDAEVWVEGAASRARAGRDGSFVLPQLPGGTQVLMTRAVGYGARRQPLELLGSDTVRVTVTLRHITTLDTINVLARANPELNELSERLRQRIGYTLTGDRLLGAGNTYALLGSVPGLLLVGQQAMGCTPRATTTNTCFTVTQVGRGQDCRAHIWLDGHPSSELDIGMVRPAEIVAVEWFADQAVIPARYLPSPAEMCAVLLVWTRDSMH